VPRITYLAGLAREAQKRETGSIESGEISEVDPGISRSETVISEILRFHLNSHVSHFLLKCHLSV